MIEKDELLYAMALQRVPNLGDVRVKKLIQAVGSAEGVFRERLSLLGRIPGIGMSRLKSLNLSVVLSEAEAEFEFIEKEGINYYYYQDKNYPQALKHCIDSPIVLFHRGLIDLEKPRILSFVGTRRATTYGIQCCEQLIEDLSVFQPVIVSGFAHGIDIAAQKKAIQMGLQTIGCLAHGLNQIYPKSHERYIKKVEANGGFVTEFWSNDVFDRKNFLKRNRIIAGLSSATIVVESAESGGSLVTADLAMSYDRELFAVPGRCLDSQSVGCNNLIKTQKAQLITSAADIVYALGWDVDKELQKVRQPLLFVELSKEEEVVAAFLKEKESEQIDMIAIECQIPVHKIASLLLQMEMKGVVSPLPGKKFKWN